MQTRTSVTRVSFHSAILLVLLSLGACRTVQTVERGEIIGDSTFAGQSALCTQLYFGLSRPDGGIVSEGEWKGFLDSIITPRFPDGLTVVNAQGQWRGANGSIVQEPSRIIVLIYEPGGAAELAIEEIRREYKRRFNQEAVLRVTGTVRIGF